MSFVIPKDESLTATLATQYVGVTIASMLYGVTCIQTFQYYRSTKAQADGWMLKASVAALLALDSLHQALIMHIVYYYLVANFGDRLTLLHNIWSIGASLVVGALIASIVQGYLILRIWRISHNIYIVGACASLTLSFLSTTFVYGIRELAYVNVLEAEAKIKVNATIGLCMSVAVDLLIAVSLSYYLQKSRTGFRRSDDLITKLMIATVTTGALTTLFAIADLAAYLAAPDQIYVLIINFSIGKLYANCFLTSLNSRDYYRSVLNADTVNTVPLSRVHADPESGNPQSDFTLRTMTSTASTMRGKPEGGVVKAPAFSLSVLDLEGEKNPVI
ncbi:hypothetical protein FA95DRAFT_1561000 [Auriscalpium vulgare]|uniref:Uncharacterized protein n=1 Tax=Auriscalpium vulgare TaxID=40419 RepID=A0ACB8RNF2_9AGAM|nr:hypothetical protein FA95DRAFT_1561000 [Auriscalpium vulgare]